MHDTAVRLHGPLHPQRVMSLDQSNNLVTRFATPAWPTPYFCAALSALGSATIMMLDAANGFKPELVRACGAPAHQPAGSFYPGIGRLCACCDGCRCPRRGHSFKRHACYCAARVPQAMFGGSGGNAGNCACDLPANDNAYRCAAAAG